MNCGLCFDYRADESLFVRTTDCSMSAEISAGISSFGEYSMDIEKRIWKVFVETMSVPCSWQQWEKMDSLKSIVNMDSMSVLEFLAALEKEFGFHFPAKDLDYDLFIQRTRLVRYIAEKVSEA